MLPLFPRLHPAELAAPTGPAWDGGTLRGHPLGRHVVDADVWRDGNGWRWSAALRDPDAENPIRPCGGPCADEAGGKAAVCAILTAWAGVFS